MIELNIIKDQYERMSDSELKNFAVNESDKLTLDSFHLLKAEFEKRNLDISVIENVEIDNALTDITTKKYFDNEATEMYAESIWQYALEQKNLMKTNYEIHQALISKGVNENYALMVLQNLEKVSNTIADEYDTNIIAGWVFLIAGLFVIFLAFAEILKSLYFLYGLISIVAGTIYLNKSYSKRKKYQNISKNIEIEKNNIQNN